jgi:ATP/maltotriose-dependent transcriptional regulator MalT
LFKRLDAALRRRVVWIGGPVGVGKTTLVASYLSFRKLKPVWHRVDVRDGDPATFFHYLSAALAQRYPRKRSDLPPLTPEFMAGLPAFAHNFFERAFGRGSGRAVVVFDNFQDLPAESPLQQMLPDVLGVLPEHVSVLLLSRESPPPQFARLEAARAMQTLDGGDLALTLVEARAIARLHKTRKLGPAALERLHERIGGWTAGWILLLERLRADKSDVEDIPLTVRDKVFGYFATEVFEGTEPDVQALLLRCAVLPEISVANARALSGLANAKEILAGLERRNYFTTRAASAVSSAVS